VTQTPHDSSYTDSGQKFGQDVIDPM